MNERITTAEALNELPIEAGVSEWPWRLVEREGRVFSEELERPQVSDMEPLPWLNVDDTSPWSAAKWLERADAIILDIDEEIIIFGMNSFDMNDGDNPLHTMKYPRSMPENLDYMKAILAIGQRAFGLGEFADWTEEQRKPWREAWDKGQNVGEL